ERPLTGGGRAARTRTPPEVRRRGGPPPVARLSSRRASFSLHGPRRIELRRIGKDLRRIPGFQGEETGRERRVQRRLRSARLPPVLPGRKPPRAAVRRRAA